MLIFDIETDGLYEEVTRIHCLAIYDTLTDKVHIFDPTTLPIEEGIRMLQEAEVICGHNIIGYDIPVIKKLYPWFDFRGEACDTLVISREFKKCLPCNFKLLWSVHSRRETLSYY